MATPGTIISGIGHVGLIGWLIVGWGLTSEPLEIQTMDVSVISGEEFDQLSARRTPEPGDADPTAPVPPVFDDTPPPSPAEEQPTETAAPPEPVEPPVSEAPPPPPPPAPPQTEVTDAPPAEPAPPVAPPPTPDVEVSETPTPPQAERIAATPSAPTPPDTQIDDVVREEVVPDDTADAEAVVEEQDATAPEEAASEIAIADEAPTTAVETSVRPTVRPTRPAPVAAEPVEETETATVEPEPTTDEDDVASALAAIAAEAAVAAAEAPAAAVGPPLTGAERDSFRLSINRCWNYDPGSEAARVVVSVGFELDRNGKVVGNNVRLISGSGGTDANIQTAFEVARRAVLRCQGETGYELPADKYEQWREVQANFDATGVRY